MVALIQRLPFLALLLLLGVGTAFFYKLGAIVALIGSIGEKSVSILLTSLSVILLLASIFALILIVLNYRLRRTAMEYQYKAQVAEKFGLVILEDNTVLNSSGKLLVNGRKFVKALEVLPERSSDGKAMESKSSKDPCGGPIPPPC
jgi:membrane protein implicated in regulation of membrane protease activity